MIQRELLSCLANLASEILLLAPHNLANRLTYIMALCLVYVAHLIYWPDEERHGVVQVRVVGFERNVVVPWSCFVSLSRRACVVAYLAIPVC